MTPFYKFHGTGNDFIIIDGFDKNPSITTTKIKEACDRNKGIGADGLIIIKPSEDHDFEMVYYNSDGSRATMCGNGARCAVALFKLLEQSTNEKITFLAGDGDHIATIASSEDTLWEVEVTLKDAAYPKKFDDLYYINTGTQHVVKFVDNISDIAILSEGSLIRHDNRFQPEGVNVNWVSILPGILTVRTYEKGVENETLSCGTGVTASALVAGMISNEKHWKIDTLGGRLEVSFNLFDDCFKNIKLKGPAKLVFTGETRLL